jgi:hypothetical protein
MPVLAVMSKPGMQMPDITINIRAKANIQKNTIKTMHQNK